MNETKQNKTKEGVTPTTDHDFNRQRYRLYQQMMDAMVNIIDSIRLTAKEDDIEARIIEIRHAIRYASRMLDDLIQIENTEAQKESMRRAIERNCARTDSIFTDRTGKML